MYIWTNRVLLGELLCYGDVVICVKSMLLLYWGVRCFVTQMFFSNILEYFVFMCERLNLLKFINVFWSMLLTLNAGDADYVYSACLLV